MGLVKCGLRGGSLVRAALASRAAPCTPKWEVSTSRAVEHFRPVLPASLAPDRVTRARLRLGVRVRPYRRAEPRHMTSTK
jgi:hypothetical protein